MKIVSLLETISKAIKGDCNSIEMLIEQYQPVVDGAINKTVFSLSPDISFQDIRQEVWFKVWSRLHSFNGACIESECQAKFGSWLSVTTANLAINIINKKRALKRGGGEKIGELRSDIANAGGKSPSSIFQREETVGILLAAIEQLKDEELTQLIHLRFFDGMTIEKITIETGLSYDQVRYKIQTAIRQLKNSLSTGTVE